MNVWSFSEASRLIRFPEKMEVNWKIGDLYCPSSCTEVSHLMGTNQIMAIVWLWSVLGASSFDDPFFYFSNCIHRFNTHARRPRSDQDDTQKELPFVLWTRHWHAHMCQVEDGGWRRKGTKMKWWIVHTLGLKVISSRKTSSLSVGCWIGVDG